MNDFWEDRYSSRFYYHEEICEELIKYINNLQVDNDSVILDFGCGAGRVCSFLLDTINSKVIGYDISKNAIKNVIENLENSTNKRLTLFCGDFNLFNLKFDHLVCHRVLHTIDPANYEVLVDKINYGLKEKGTIFISARSVECQEASEIRNNVNYFSVGRNSFKNKLTNKFIHFLEEEEITELFPKLFVVEKGYFFEKSGKRKKDNKYIYFVFKKSL
jgi:cyclopropane fatty-acyl-phospholipid synthase-like methyltransferase